MELPRFDMDSGIASSASDNNKIVDGDVSSGLIKSGSTKGNVTMFKTKLPDMVGSDVMARVILMRKAVGAALLTVGVIIYITVSSSVGAQIGACQQEFGECVWNAIKPKLYFENGLMAGTTCGFGVEGDLEEDTWNLDITGCRDHPGVTGLFQWHPEFGALKALNMTSNGVTEYPFWLLVDPERLPYLEELVLRDNDLTEFPVALIREGAGVGGGGNSSRRALVLVDVSGNAIENLPYESMDLRNPWLELNFNDNPCSSHVNWAGLEVDGRAIDRLPERVTNSSNYDNGNFSSTLRVLDLSHNAFDKSVIKTMADNGFVNVTELSFAGNGVLGLEVEDFVNVADPNRTKYLPLLEVLVVDGNELGK